MSLPTLPDRIERATEHEKPHPRANRGSAGRAAAVGGLVGALVTSASLGGAWLLSSSTTSAAPSKPAATATAVPLATSAASNVATAGFTADTANFDVHAILSKINPAVVAVNVKGFDQSYFGVQPTQGAGTGIVLTSDGEILTNNHVIEGATSIKVEFADKKVREARVIGSDPTNDIALIKVTGASGLTTAKLGASSSTRVGDPVVAVGNALALPGGPTVTSGIVSALDRAIDTENDEHLTGLLQTDAAINPGNSGGPLVNASGEVIGMNTAGASGSNNIGFAIAIDHIKSILSKLRNGTSANATSTRAFLGVNSTSVTRDLASQYGLSVTKGALIASVVPGSPAELAGLQSGDVITKLDGTTIADTSTISTVLGRHHPGDRIAMTWVDSSGSHSATITLGSHVA